MVQFPGFLPPALCVQTGVAGILNQPGYPIRQPPDLWMFAPPRGFSQLTTAFIVR